uniref:Uncharacterized protein n=1 Tax=Anser cygnoides TaxID=8845 RepID=A0A8B9ERX9_ANSCY
PCPRLCACWVLGRGLSPASNLDVRQYLLPLCQKESCYIISQTHLSRSNNRISCQHQLFFSFPAASKVHFVGWVSCVGNSGSPRRA